MIKKGDVENFAIGFGSYYLILYVIIFCIICSPVIVMTVQFNFLVGFVVIFVILGLLAGYFFRRKIGYLILLIGIYLSIAHPFCQWARWVIDGIYEKDIGPFPGFDWFRIFTILIKGGNCLEDYLQVTFLTAVITFSICGILWLIKPSIWDPKDKK